MEKSKRFPKSLWYQLYEIYVMHLNAEMLRSLALALQNWIPLL